MADAVLEAARDGDVVITMGAGSMGGVAPEVVGATKGRLA
jgi:UDP-N-acetylmuramate-alanine ligase